ncbi:hypothetical protein E4U43_005487 [Claviceps pusilla]|uniref:WLM domain-containing protein n=1 Tax=Claviceps pusilla TaxID=123648 RepID=A0A9P7NFC6_9HYPO|nr:hypothetical protein E4U43_005487 [Claviceps pusilla]
MPVGIQRLNARRSQPNPNIVFIKPLSGPGEKTAQTFLERIAAQCLPIMRRNHISVMTLEEYEPNREFVGRNFNAGEVVQLVLRSVRSGRWLPFEYVQMVMMHELAHCKQMNHSRAFWAVRNQYAAQMEDLWREGYTGEGIWGRGANLATGEWERNTVQSGEEMLSEHLCGGTYRSRGRGRRRGRKRGATEALSYQERKQRRILRKFGENGVALGADEETKVKLEKGKKIAGKPRVAGSARGRDLRAAAALARFEQQQKVEIKEDHDSKNGEEEEEMDMMEDSGSESGSQDEVEDDNEGGSSLEGALDVDGTRMLDRKGRQLVKVCEDDATDANDSDARTELSQLRDMLNRHAKQSGKTCRPTVRIKNEACSDDETDVGSSITASVRIKNEPCSDDDETNMRSSIKASGLPKNESCSDDYTNVGSSITASLFPHRKLHMVDGPQTGRPSPTRPSIKKENASTPTTPAGQPTRAAGLTCSMCSFENEAVAATCCVCAHVLNAALTPDTWRCGNATCKGTGYVNSGDCGVCGLCGARRL